MESRLFYTQLVSLTCMCTHRTVHIEKVGPRHTDVFVGWGRTVNNETNSQAYFDFQRVDIFNLFFELVVLLHVSKFQKYQKI